MGFFGWLGKPAKSAGGKPKVSRSQGAPHSTQFVHSQSQPHSANPSSQHAIRKDLLKVVLRETLMRNGIPASWIGADLLRSSSPKRNEPGIHVRLLIRHWDPRLMMCGVAFEQNFYKRLVAMDPMASTWLMGVSWQYTMEDLSQCPQLPHPGSWTSQAPLAGETPVPVPVMDAAGGDVIAGPVVIQQPQDDVRSDLERLLSARDDDVKRHGGRDPFASTQPISL